MLIRKRDDILSLLFRNEKNAQAVSFSLHLRHDKRGYKCTGRKGDYVAFDGSVLHDTR